MHRQLAKGAGGLCLRYKINNFKGHNLPQTCRERPLYQASVSMLFNASREGTVPSRYQAHFTYRYTSLIGTDMAIGTLRFDAPSTRY